MINEIIIPIRWADLDAYNHVGNQHYFEYMMEARGHLLADIRKKKIDCLFVVAETRCQYKKSYLYPGNVLVQQYLLGLGTTSFELNYLLSTPEEPETIRAEGYAKMVCVDPVEYRPIKLPEMLKQLLSPTDKIL